MTTPLSTPTRETYTELQHAYDVFNRELFAGELPHCLITLQRKSRRTYGYFSHRRFARGDGTTTDEIAMNPMWFKERDLMEALQTLAHEMCHLWQAHFGTPSRSGYHNHEWAAKMQAIGLMPSSTGKPGGAIVGQHMADYVIELGAFERVAGKLIADGFALTWHDVRVVEEDAAPVTAPTGTGAGPAPSRPAPLTTAGKRTKYVCPACRAAVWGRRGLYIACLPCAQPLTPA